MGVEGLGSMGVGFWWRGDGEVAERGDAGGAGGAEEVLEKTVESR